MSERRPTRRRVGLLAVGVLFWLAIGVMAIPNLGGVAISLAGPVAAPVAAHSPHHAAAVVPLPGAASSSAINAGASNGFLPSAPRTSAVLPFQSNINQYLYSRQVWAHENASAAANATAAQARAHPDLTIPTGKFSGYVYNSLTGAAVQGVTVEAYSVGAAICPATTCAP
ncbi:MAG: hypothetical protein L3J87_00780, partial [Thermoplasmata archaeon]|nr:hypothetical protein [Thermoplasmata archaeon]